MTPTRPFLNTREAAEYLGISRTTLYQWTSKKLLPYLKVNRKLIFFKQADLDDFILNSPYYKSNDAIEQEAIQLVRGTAH